MTQQIASEVCREAVRPIQKVNETQQESLRMLLEDLCYLLGGAGRLQSTDKNCIQLN